MYSFEEKLCLWLNSFEGLYSKKQKDILGLFESCEKLCSDFASRYDDLSKFLTKEQFVAMSKSLESDGLFKAEEEILKADISAITMLSENYPEKLKYVDEPPTVLYYKGDIKLLDKLSIAVVGSRKSASYGERVTKLFVKNLVENDFTIVSGMALGIDSVAHNTCLENNGKTIAVLGSGLNCIYPMQNLQLSHRIIDKGLLVSEFAPKITPEPFHFPMRNRIVSGLSDGILIVEAGKKSGTYTTLNHALEQGKKIYIVPNDIFSFSSIGSNEMLKNLQGAFVTEPQDIVNDFSIVYRGVQKKQKIQLDFDQQKLVDFLKSGSKHFNEILCCGFSTSDLQFMLSDLEIKGIVEKESGNFFKLTMEGIE